MTPSDKFPFPISPSSVEAANKLMQERKSDMRMIVVTGPDGQKAARYCDPKHYDQIKEADEAFQKALTLTKK
jgi:PHD/YefM family antitoxin component YafN of YafNO toxin-antitoxin module